MDLSGKELGSLRFIERWATYKASDGALSMEQVITRDRRYFSSILSEEDTKVSSFNMENIPEADAMLVFGYPRVLAYAAEIAVRYRDKYGDYPELFSVSDGCDALAQWQEMDKWIPQQLTVLGFPAKWAFKNCRSHAEKIRAYTTEANILLQPFSLKLRRRPKVLVVTNAGCSMSAAQELISAMPHTDFLIFETPRLQERIFDNEKLSKGSYGVDVLLAQVARCRLNGRKVGLPIEKLLNFPRMNRVRDLLYRGYAGCFVSKDMWKCVGITPAYGIRLHQARIDGLQSIICPKRIEKQTRRLLDTVSQSLEKKGLII